MQHVAMMSVQEATTAAITGGDVAPKGVVVGVDIGMTFTGM